MEKGRSDSLIKKVMAPKREEIPSSSTIDMKSSGDTLDKGSVTTAPTMCNFVVDFSTLCVEEMTSYIPDVDVIGLVPSRHQLSNSASTASESKSCEDMQPKVQVLFDNPEKCFNLRMIHMKGIGMEPGLLRATGRCLPLFPTITVLKLEDCDLKSEDLIVIASLLAETGIVKELSLNENPVKEMNYNCILQINTRIEHLSLCQCQINNEGARLLALELTYKEPATQALLTLNLTHNRITADGIQYLANALRTNRTLVSLSLAGNRILDHGAIALAEVLQRFPLWHEECVERRQRNLARLLKRQTLATKQNFSSSAVLSQSPKGGGSRGTSSKRNRRGSKEQREDSSPSPTEGKKLEQPVEQEKEEDTHPYMQEVKAQDGDLWCSGNFKLAHLNLAHNHIGLSGAIAFHAAILYQDKILQNSRNGLLRLLLQGNPIPPTCFEFRQMLEVINNRYDHANEKITNGNNTGVQKRHSSKKNSFSKRL